jgi:hypothetical protein
MLQAFNLNPMSFGRNVALDALDMLSETAYGNLNLVGNSPEVYGLLLLLRLSDRF